MLSLWRSNGNWKLSVLDFLCICVYVICHLALPVVHLPFCCPHPLVLLPSSISFIMVTSCLSLFFHRLVVSMKVHRELNNFLFGLPFIALWWGWCSLLGPPGMFPTRSSWMIVVTGQVCLCYIPDQMTLPVYLGTSCCVLAILLPTGDSLFTSFCSPGILLPKWQLLTKHHNTIFTYYTYAITLTPCISSQ